MLKEAYVEEEALVVESNHVLLLERESYLSVLTVCSRQLAAF